MKIGFNALCFHQMKFEDVIDFASKNGFSQIEVVCSPKDTIGLHHIDVEDIDEKSAGKIKELLKKKGVSISCLSHYANILMPFEEDEDYHISYLSKVISAAAELGVDKVSTFTGSIPGISIQENINIFAEKIWPLLTKAKSLNVKVMLENTPLIGMSGPGGNFAYSPELWDMIFTKLPDENLGLNYDPSHLFWLGADYMLFLKLFSDRIFQVQAKDAEILVERLRMTGILSGNWFRYRIPGYGSIDWRKFISSLYEAGYDDVLIIENEDSVWSGDIEKIGRGLLLGKKFIKNFVI
ncbi:MAG: TIM barrel protein [Candidatus Eremiobacteraeota bacterium]|nr:TIM barrel protein [Candidatus Eremiobacteraeota bacterium]